MEDLRNASELLLKALEVREKYMKFSHQSFPNLVKRFLMSMGSSGSPLPGTEAYDDGTHDGRATLEGMNFFNNPTIGKILRAYPLIEVWFISDLRMHFFYFILTVSNELNDMM